jgi:opacity protein-like surface antigen
MKPIRYSLLFSLFATFTHVGIFPSSLWAEEPFCVVDPKAPCTGWKENTGYVFAYGGGSFLGDFTGFNFRDNDPYNLTTEDAGLMVGGGVGVYSCFLGGSRFELEGLYSESNITNQDLFLGLPSTGDVKIKASMVNLLKEIPLGCLTGYVGGGAGVAEVEFFERYAGLNIADGSRDNALAWQLIAGVDLPVSERLSLFTQYKLIGIGETDHSLQFNADVTMDAFTTHHLVLGARLAFGGGATKISGKESFDQSDSLAYLFAYGGGSFGDNLTGFNFRDNDPYNLAFSDDAGLMVGGGVGVYSNFLGGSRFELEGLYSESDISNQLFLGRPSTGDVEIKASMVNLLKEIPLGCMTGYIGGGAGVAEVEFFERQRLPGLVNAVVSSDHALAWQLIAGVDLPVSERLSLFTQYKLLGIGETDHLAELNDYMEMDAFTTQSITAGARISLGSKRIAGETPMENSETGYLFAYGGGSFADDFTGFDFQTMRPYNLALEDDGVMVGGGLGVYSCFLGGSRFELEGLYSESGISNQNFQGIPSIGDVEIKASMINLLKEIPLGCLTGYIGGGAGVAEVKFFESNSTRVADVSSDHVLAWQLITGVDLPVSERLSLFTQYKLLGVGETDHSSDINNNVVMDAFKTQSITAGVRVGF